jgi:hypothetical protein
MLGSSSRTPRGLLRRHPRREKKEESKKEREEIPSELLEETRPWWVEHRELQAMLSCHPDDPTDAPD